MERERHAYKNAGPYLNAHLDRRIAILKQKQAKNKADSTDVPSGSPVSDLRNALAAFKISVKREILSCLGSDLVLKDRTLMIHLSKPLSLFGEFAPEVQGLHKRLEPPKAPKNQEEWEVLYAQNSRWGPLLDQVRTCLRGIAA
jgi:hypothetical protein